MTADNNRIIKQVYLLTSNKKSTSFGSRIKKLLTRYKIFGKEEKDIKDETIEQLITNIYEINIYLALISVVMLHEEDQWLESMKWQPKLRTYIKFKKKLRLEKYLLGSSQYSLGRRYHTSLRNGTNVLEIEKGRWKYIHKDSRFAFNATISKSKMRYTSV